MYFCKTFSEISQVLKSITALVPSAYFIIPSILPRTMTSISEKVLQKYIRQLSSYSYAITHPFSNSDFSLKLRNQVGLFVFEPDKFSIDYNSRAGLKGQFKYISYDIDLESFENYVKNEFWWS